MRSFFEDRVVQVLQQCQFRMLQVDPAHDRLLDGVHAHELGSGRAEFCEHGEVTDGDVADLVSAIRDRVLRLMRRAGKWPAAGEAAAADSDGDAADLMLELGAAAVQGRTALRELAGAMDARVGRGTHGEPFVKGPLCADVDGFSLHAAVRVEARDRKRLEHLCRYAGRPAIAESRLSLLPDGRVLYALTKRWQDGTTSVVLEPQVLIERPCALVPRPRRHLVTYHGVLAPAAGIRPWVVPRVEAGERGGCRHEDAGAESDEPDLRNDTADDVAVRRLLRHRTVPHRPGRRRRGGRRYRWAELLRRVYMVDVLLCRHCGREASATHAIHDPESVRQVLVAMGLSPEVPVLCPARGPQRWRSGWSEFTRVQ